MVDVNALKNLDIDRVKDIYLGVDVKNHLNSLYYVFAVVENELYKYDTEVLCTCHNDSEAVSGLYYFKLQLEMLRLEVAGES